MDFLRNKDLGFNKDQVLTVAANSNKDLTSNIRAFKDEVHNNPCTFRRHRTGRPAERSF